MDAPPPVAPRKGEVGLLLRSTREGAGIDLRAASEALRIRYAHLQAIEEGRYHDLPGATYAVGFVRAYAEYLGLDGNEIVRRFKDESAIIPKQNELDFPTPVNEGGLPSGAVILIALALGAAIYGVWYWGSSSDRSVAEMIQEVPERLTALLNSAPQEPAVPATTGSQATGMERQGAPVTQPSTPPTAVSEGEGPSGGDAPQARTAAADPAGIRGDGNAVPASAPTTAPDVAAQETEGPITATVGDETVIPETAAPSAGDIASAPASEEAAAVEAPSEDVTAASNVTGSSGETATALEAPQVPPPPSPSDVTETPAPAPEETSEGGVAAVPAAPDGVAEEGAPLPPQLAEEAALPADGRVFGAENRDARVILRARADSWVQVRDENGLLLTRLLRRGDSYRVPNRDGLTLMTGNAGGLLIEVDGRLLPPLGRMGEVRRGIPLDVERLQAGEAGPN